MMSAQKSWLRVFVLAVLVVVLPVMALAQQRRAAVQSPPSAPVTVVNTTANPVPTTATVSGTVDIGSMPKVDVRSMPAVTGTVNVGNTPNVNVVNAAANPVPVTGTVNVGTMPAVSGTVNIGTMPAVGGTVDAKQSGAWNVGVNSMPAVSLASGANVQVNNSTSNPVPVLLTNGAAQQPVQRMASQTVPPLSTGISLMYIVPAGFRLVIEYVSVDTLCGVLGGQISAGIRVMRAVGGSDELVVRHFIPLTQGPPVGSLVDRNVGGQAVRIYAEPGNKVEAVVFFGGAGAFGLDYTMAFSGHLEPL